MLDDLAGIINGIDGFIMLGVLSAPEGVLVVSGGLFSGIGGLVVLDVLDVGSEVGLGLSKGFSGVVSQLGVGLDLNVVIVDVVFQINGDSVTSSLVGSVNSVVFSLVLDQLSDDLVQQHVDLINGGASLQVGLDGRKNHVSEGFRINLS